MDEFNYRKFENYKKTQDKSNSYDIPTGRAEMPFLSDAERKMWKALLRQDRMREEEE